MRAYSVEVPDALSEEVVRVAVELGQTPDEFIGSAILDRVEALKDAKSRSKPGQSAPRCVS